MSELGLSALQLEVTTTNIKVYLYRIIYQKFDETEAIEKLAPKVAYEIQKNNHYEIITNLGGKQIISLKPILQLAINLPQLQANLAEEGNLELDCSNEQHQQALQRLINQDINKAAWKLAESSQGKLAYKKVFGNTEISETTPSTRIETHTTYLDTFCSVQLNPEILSDGTVLIGLHLKHTLVAKSAISMQWVIDKKPDWIDAIKKVRHKYFESGKSPLVAEFVKADKTLNGNSLLPNMGKSLVEYHKEKGLLSEQQLSEAATSVLIKVKYGYGKNEADHVASLVEPMFDFDTLSRIDSVFLNRLAKNLKWSLDDRIKTSAKMVNGLYLPSFKSKLIAVDYQNMKRQCLEYKQSLQFANGAKSHREQDVLKYKAFANMTRTKVIPLIVGKENDTEQNRNLLCDTYNALNKITNTVPPLTSYPVSIENADDLDARLYKNRQDNVILLIGLTLKSNKTAIRDVTFNYGLATQFMRLDHNSKTYNSSYFNNVAAGLFSKGGGQLHSIDNMPGDTDLFIGLDMGGVTVRAPGSAFLYLSSGTQLGWQLADMQKGEKMQDTALMSLLVKSLTTYLRSSDGELPRRITLHRDGKFYESIKVIEQFERECNVKLDVLEVVKSGAPVLYRKYRDNDNKQRFNNPNVGDAVYLSDQELILSTYNSEELGKSWGDKVSVRPLRLRKRYGETSLDILAQQVLILSRIHGASLYRHPRLPVTTHHADRFATLRQEASIDALSKMDRLCPIYL